MVIWCTSPLSAVLRWCLVRLLYASKQMDKKTRKFYINARAKQNKLLNAQKIAVMV